MSTLTLTVVHTIDPTALEILRTLFVPKTQDSTPIATPTPATPVASVPVQSFAPSIAPPAQPQQFTAPSPAVPVAAPAPAQVPVVAPQQVPTAAATYTVEQLSQAAALFAEVSDSNRDTVMRLLAQYGVQMLQQLQPEQFNAFAMSLREAGAKI